MIKMYSYIQEIMDFLQGDGEEIMMIGVVSEFLHPQEAIFGEEIYGNVIKQFQKDNNLVDTVLMICDNGFHLKQPCFCKCDEYRKKSHRHFDCDICHRIPIGILYTCGKCADICYNLCEDCHGKHGHSCGDMDKIMDSSDPQAIIDKYSKIPKA